ncbi:MAG: hypothetical protein A2270_09755 [Elusimicrobia bacterium RIFOXYA12_FULL_51_18]|nr:MAG: hypothetical protein A2270_09755 [Elusimicrobia bacterium RIFOXYA12_FULL_51_18]OGS32786.1 MAG: hypothetical protein A2218_12070 [Elusimicrobia bacterium RIFOXYA2_FULL_53_38]
MKILLANFAECPENLHFEQALIRAFNGEKGASLDIVHDFQFPYSFIEKLPPSGGGRRIKYSGLPGLKRELRSGYDILLLLDFPKRKACAAPFLWLLKDAACVKKIFIANHLLPMPGHNPTADIVSKLGLLSVLDLACIFEFDDRSLWSELGLRYGRAVTRGYAVDCLYYTPVDAPSGDYIFTAGSAGRDFAGLARVVEKAGLMLKIFTDQQVAFKGDFRTSVSVFPFAKNLHNLREAVREAKAVVLPIADKHINEAAGNSIAFIAMACGRPVITRWTRYMGRFIESGGNGFFYKSLSQLSLARQLKRALSLNAAASRRLAKAARAVVLKKASLDVFAARFVRKFIFRR